MPRSSVACTTSRRSSAPVTSARASPRMRDHEPTYIDGAYCAWIPHTASSASGSGRSSGSSRPWRASSARFRSRWESVCTRARMSGRRAGPRPPRTDARLPRHDRPRPRPARRLDPVAGDERPAQHAAPGARPRRRRDRRPRRHPRGRRRRPSSSRASSPATGRRRAPRSPATPATRATAASGSPTTSSSSPRGAPGRATTRCTGCRATLTDGEPGFWATVRSSGCFPTVCPLCGSDLPQWRQIPPAGDDPPSRTTRARSEECT